MLGVILNPAGKLAFVGIEVFSQMPRDFNAKPSSRNSVEVWGRLLIHSVTQS